MRNYTPAPVSPTQLFLFWFTAVWKWIEFCVCYLKKNQPSQIKRGFWRKGTTEFFSSAANDNSRNRRLLIFNYQQGIFTDGSLDNGQKNQGQKSIRLQPAVTLLTLPALLLSSRPARPMRWSRWTSRCLSSSSRGWHPDGPRQGPRYIAEKEVSSILIFRYQARYPFPIRSRYPQQK